MAHEGYISEAGVLLDEAEKILEYGANRGKEISRQLIVTVLHNQAFCHQQNWQLERCSNYIEALIYNLNCEIREEGDCEDGLILRDNMEVRSKLTHYYLLFCAVNSQLKRNEGALIAAKRANNLLTENSLILYRLAKKVKAEIELNTLILLEELSSSRFKAEDTTP